MKIPKHLAVIPDGNRRWAQKNKLPPEEGYGYGLRPGIELFKLCQDLGVKELTYYGFTMDNTKRPKKQSTSFRQACVKAVEIISEEDVELLVVGNHHTPMFPEELRPYTSVKQFGRGGMRVNFLVNYGWKWDLAGRKVKSSTEVESTIKSSEISRVDLLVRWGGRRRLSGFLPVQTVYSDIYVVSKMWPEFKAEHLLAAFEWYQDQDPTYGG